MAEKALIDKAGETVGVGIEMAADVVSAIKTAFDAAVSTVKEEVVKKVPAKAVAKKAPVKKVQQKQWQRRLPTRGPRRRRLRKLQLKRP